MNRPDATGLDHLLRQRQPDGLEAHAQKQQQEALDHQLGLSVCRDGDARADHKDVEEQDPAEVLSAKRYAGDKDSHWHARFDHLCHLRFRSRDPVRSLSIR